MSKETRWLVLEVSRCIVYSTCISAIRFTLLLPAQLRATSLRRASHAQLAPQRQARQDCRAAPEQGLAWEVCRMSQHMMALSLRAPVYRKPPSREKVTCAQETSQLQQVTAGSCKLSPAEQSQAGSTPPNVCVLL